MTDYVEESKKTHVALIHESWKHSAANDLTTVAIFIGLWSFGYFVGSAALEWVGVFIAGFIIFARALGFFKRAVDKRMTPKQARLWLDANFPESGT